MAVSTSALVARVRAYLDERPYVSTGTLSNGTDTTCDVTDGTGWDTGAIVEFQDNGEQCFVQSVSSNTLTVTRGWNGTTAITHAAVQVWRDPQYTYDTITKCIESAVRRLWPYAWKATDDTITPLSDGTVWYDLAAGALALIKVQQIHGATSDSVGTYGDGRDNLQVIFDRHLPTAIATSGVGLRFPHGFYHSSNTVSVRYAAAITGTSDIEDDGELAVTDAVIYGALARLMAGKELERVTLGEDAEVARSVRVGGRLSAGAYYERLFREELEALRVAHQAQLPIMPTKKFK